jgi:hypothetical protein
VEGEESKRKKNRNEEPPALCSRDDSPAGLHSRAEERARWSFPAPARARASHPPPPRNRPQCAARSRAREKRTLAAFLPSRAGPDFGPRPQTRAPAAHGSKAHFGHPHKHALSVEHASTAVLTRRAHTPPSPYCPHHSTARKESRTARPSIHPCRAVMAAVKSPASGLPNHATSVRPCACGGVCLPSSSSSTPRAGDKLLLQRTRLSKITSGTEGGDPSHHESTTTPSHLSTVAPPRAARTTHSGSRIGARGGRPPGADPSLGLRHGRRGRQRRPGR